MAAGDTHAYRNFVLNQETANNATNFGTDSISIMFLKNTYTPNYTADQYIGSVSSHEVTAGTAYLNNGISLSAVSMTVSGSFAILKIGNISLAQDNANGFNHARYGVVYEKTGAAATSQLICLVDFGSDISNTAGPITISYTANKILKWQI